MLNAESFFLAELLPNAATQPSGESMQLNVDFIRFDRWYYAAVRAIDRSGNHGRISNRVKLWMPSPPTTSTSWPSTQSSGVNGAPPQWFSGGLSTVHWIAIIASIFFAVLVFIIAIYFVVSSKRQKEKEVNPVEPRQYPPSTPFLNLKTLSTPQATLRFYFY